jgi:hypothetical protein
MRRLEWDVMGAEETERLCKRLVMHARSLVAAYRDAG